MHARLVLYPIIETQGRTPLQGLRHYATVARRASMTARSWFILWLLYIRYTAELGYLRAPFCPVEPFFCRKTIRPALSKHKSIVRPPSTFSARAHALVHRL